MLLHQILTESLASFNDSSICLRTKARDTDLIQTIHTTQHQGIIGSDHRVINGIVLGEVHDTVKVGSADIHAGSIRRNAAVTGKRIDGFHIGIFL